MSGQWSVERARAWSAERPYGMGANFYPSNAINQLEMWQAETFSPEVIARELGFARRLGMTLMRVYLHDLLWEEDPVGFLERLEYYLDLADSQGISTMFVFFDDCWRSEFALGPQPKPIPFTHNSGWLQSPGKKIVNDPSQWGRLRDYVQGVLKRFQGDDRVALWDLYNEPGNGTSGDAALGNQDVQGKKSLPLLEAVFAWAREVDPQQPLTVAVWCEDDAFSELNAFSLAHSDITSFHAYLPATELMERVERIRQGTGR